MRNRLTDEPIRLYNRLMNPLFYEPIKCYNRLMKQYNWQKSDWPHFRYDESAIEQRLIQITEKTGFIKGSVSHLDDRLRLETVIDLMLEEAVTTSEIEGEYINRPDVRSSIKNKLGYGDHLPIKDKRANNIVNMLFNVRSNFEKALTKTMLFSWHTMLLKDVSKIKIGNWRTHEEPMQIISGFPGKQILHFEAPPSKIVPHEMARFINWFNDTAPNQSNAIRFAPIRAAIAHLYFESIHPFEDGNGRIGRALAEKALSQGFGYPSLFSLSKSIEAKRKKYYEALHQASLSNEITEWLIYFVEIISNGLTDTELQINFILKKAKFYEKFKSALSERQLKVINKMFKAGFQGFEGGMNARKYMQLTQVSKATATRDLQQLAELQVFKVMGSGRSVRYELNL